MAFSPPVASLTFLKFDRVIQVDAGQSEVTIQDLINQIRDYEDEISFLDYGKIADAFGKQDLGGSEFVGITMVLLNEWRVQFESPGSAPTVNRFIRGGNLVADNTLYSDDPIKPSDYVTVIIAQSSSPTIATPESDYHLMYMIENLHGTHKSVGNVFYWDPTDGSDTNDGITPSTAVATFAAAEALCAVGNHDIIFALANDVSGVTTYTTPITISKDTVKLRGPGYQFQLVPSSSGTDTVAISGNSVEFSGFYVKTAGGGTDDGISIGSSVNNTLIKDCWIDSATSNGIIINGASRTKIQTCAIESSAAAGISIADSTTLSKITQSIVTGSTGDGVELAGSSSTDNIFEDNLIYNNGGYGIDIGTSVTRTGVRKHHTFSGNTSGSTRDLGSATFIETPAGGASASDIADAVWDELIDDHVTAGTTGKTLKDAKTRATLASLK